MKQSKNRKNLINKFDVQKLYNATDAIKFTVDKTVVSNSTPKSEEEIACAIDDGDDCEMCSG